MSAPSSSHRFHRVALIGLGAVGCQVLGRLLDIMPGLSISLVDGDRVDAANLGRQTLYQAADIGSSKVLAAASRLSGALEPRDVFIASGNAHDLIAGHHLIIDCTDDLFAKEVIDAVSGKHRIPLITGGAHGLHAQKVALHIPGADSELRRRDVFSGRITEEQSGCDMTDVPMDVITALGTRMAESALAILNGESVLNGRMDLFDARTGIWTSYELHPLA